MAGFLFHAIFLSVIFLAKDKGSLQSIRTTQGLNSDQEPPELTICDDWAVMARSINKVKPDPTTWLDLLQSADWLKETSLH